MTRVLVAAGTRPEAIKLAPVLHELSRRPDQFDSVFCATAQHREMLDQVVRAFNLCPSYDLNIMRPRQQLAALTATLLERMTSVLAEIKPDWVLVQGDTTTAMATALAAFYLRIPVGHVEAGLRTGDKSSPFPEEVNRRIVDSVSDLMFAPTPAAMENLRLEGVSSDRVIVTGNTGVDALIHVASLAIPSAFDRLAAALNGRRLILVTAHRRENFGEPLARICRSILTLISRYPDELAFLIPVHLNPNVRQAIHARLAEHPSVTLTEPLDYIDFVKAMKHAFLILTDSGGIQEEAPTLHKPVLVLRDTTERQEAVSAGTARLVGTDDVAIVEAVEELLHDSAAYRAMSQANNPFGDGHASERIVDALAGRALREAGGVLARTAACSVR